MGTEYLQDLLSDAEGYLADARRGDLPAAQEALDTVNYYQTLRENGEGEEPWEAADDYAGDMETEAIDIIEKLTRRARPRAKTCKDYGCTSWACWLLGFHVKGPHDDPPNSRLLG
jgi:hypothetical protein